MPAAPGSRGPSEKIVASAASQCRSVVRSGEVALPGDAFACSRPTAGQGVAAPDEDGQLWKPGQQLSRTDGGRKCPPRTMAKTCGRHAHTESAVRSPNCYDLTKPAKALEAAVLAAFGNPARRPAAGGMIGRVFAPPDRATPVPHLGVWSRATPVHLQLVPRAAEADTHVVVGMAAGIRVCPSLFLPALSRPILPAACGLARAQSAARCPV